MYNTEIAELFNEIADMMELEGERFSRFEVLAYRKAVVTLGTLQEDVGEIYKKRGVDGLMELPGVGKSIAGSIEEFIKTGKMKKYEGFKKKYPIKFRELTKIQSMGAKKAYKLYKALGVKNMGDLKKALAKHKIRDLEGFGEQSEEQIRRGVEFLEQSGGRMLLGTALPEAEIIRDRLLKSGLVEKAIIGGSTRRMRETVGDLDILVISGKAEKVMEFLIRMPEVESVIVRGPTKTAVRLKIGLNCDVRVVPKASFGAALQYFTGNKDHNVKVREIAIKKGYKLNEYGLFNKKNRNVAAGENEEEVYKKLGMEWMQPEMRENRGEVELALAHKIPKIIELKDIRGDLQVHANPAGGVTDSLDKMVDEARKMGLEYLGITNHSKSLYVEKGMNDRQLESFFKTIDRLNEKLDEKLEILKSAETDILNDGSLDLGDKILDQMDYRFAAVHSNMKMSKEEMTKRVVKAINSGHVNILGHPTARLINKRELIALDLDKVFEAAKDNGVVMEIDAQPDRLDLNDENAIKAKEYGLKFCTDTDAHTTAQLNFMRYGVGVAKRAWLEKKDVINTLELGQLLKFFKK